MIYEYKINSNVIYPVFYQFNLDGSFDKYECKNRNSKGGCYYSDSILYNNICDNKIDNILNHAKINPADSLAFSYDNYAGYFKEPYRLKSFELSRRKDTILLSNDSLFKTVYKIPKDAFGYRYFQRVILDSLFYKFNETVLVFKEERLSEKDGTVLFQENTTPRLYYVTTKHILFEEKVLAIFDKQHYVTIRELVNIKKCVCSQYR